MQNNVCDNTDVKLANDSTSVKDGDSSAAVEPATAAVPLEVLNVDGRASPIESSHSERQARAIDESTVLAEGEEKNSLFLSFLTFAAALSGFLFGYDTGVISGVLVIIGDDLGLTLGNVEKEWITSSLTVGALIGGLGGGVLADRIGRKKVLAVSDFFFILGAIVQSAASNLAAMLAGRLVMGFGVGIAAGIAPLFIGELAPTTKRGRLVTISQPNPFFLKKLRAFPLTSISTDVVAITGGQVVAYALGAAFTHVDHGWRALVALGCAPAVVQMGKYCHAPCKRLQSNFCLPALLHIIPESPRYLLRKDRSEEAVKVVRKIYPYATEKQVQLKVGVMESNVAAIRKVEESLTVAQRLRRIFRNGPSRRALIIACGLQAFQQLSGFNSLMYFSSSLFEQVGFQNSTAVSLIVAGTNCVFTIIAFMIIEYVPVALRTKSGQ